MTNNQELRFVSIKTKLFLSHPEIFVSSVLTSLQSVSTSSAEDVTLVSSAYMVLG